MSVGEGSGGEGSGGEGSGRLTVAVGDSEGTSRPGTLVTVLLRVFCMKSASVKE